MFLSKYSLDRNNLIFEMAHTQYFFLILFLFLLDYDYITLLRTGSGYIGRSARLGLELSPFCGK
jgi:hypothetical protein